MARLSAAQRQALPPSAFGVPSKAPGPGSYPMPDAQHAQVAKGRASQFASAGIKGRVDAKANQVLRQRLLHRRGRRKKQQAPQQAPAQMPGQAGY